jgi:hypothetical protein
MSVVCKGVKAEEVASVASDIKDAAKEGCGESAAHERRLHFPTSEELVKASKCLKDVSQAVITLYDGLLPVSVEEHARIRQYLQELASAGDRMCDEVAEGAEGAEWNELQWAFVSLATYGKKVNRALCDVHDIKNKCAFIDKHGVENAIYAIGDSDITIELGLPFVRDDDRPNRPFWEECSEST